MQETGGRTSDVPRFVGILILILGFLLTFLGTLPLAFLNYAFVERPGIILGKRLLQLCDGQTIPKQQEQSKSGVSECKEKTTADESSDEIEIAL